MSDDLIFKGNEVAEHAQWPELEKRIATAFEALKQESVYTSTNITGTSGDGETEIRENLESEDGEFTGYAYYNSLDKKEGRASGQLCINIASYVDEDTWEQDPEAISEIAKKVTKACTDAQLKVNGPDEVLPNMLMVSLG